MKKHLLLGIFVLFLSQAFAQGTWNVKQVKSWSYDLTGEYPSPENFAAQFTPPAGDGLSLVVAGGKVELIKDLTTYPLGIVTRFVTYGGAPGSLVLPSFLPKPGNQEAAYLRLGSKTTGAYFIPGTKTFGMPLHWKDTQTKYSLSNIEQSTAIARYTFTLKFNGNNRATTSGLRIYTGTKDAAFLTNTSNVSTSAISNVHAGLQFKFEQNADGIGDLSLQYRRKGTGTSGIPFSDITLPGLLEYPLTDPALPRLKQNGTYNVEWYCNNTTSAQTYTRGSVKYEIKPMRMHLWVNNIRGTYSDNLIDGETKFDIPNNTMTTAASSANEYIPNEALGGILFQIQTDFGAEIGEDVQISNLSARYAVSTTSEAVPVIFSSFSAQQVSTEVKVKWSTESEVANANFEVLRSTDGGNTFSVLGTVATLAAAGNSDQPLSYEFTDSNPVIGVNSYKVRQVSLNASSTEIDPMEVTVEALPITLSSFTAKKVNDMVNLNWSTASESNNSHFEVLRSLDGSNFSQLGRIAGAGTTLETRNYFFTDFSPVAGINYYKLRQVDFNSESTDSEVKTVSMDLKTNSFQVISDIVQGAYALVTSHTPGAKGYLRVLDVSGRVLFEQDVKLNDGSTKISLPVSLPGVYVASFVMGGKAYSSKFVK